MFAIIQTGGKQLRVAKGDTIFVEKIESKSKKIEFDKVLMIDNNFGTPFLEKAVVVGKILKQGKQKKIVVFKCKPKKNYHKKYGHRQPYTKVLIENIISDKNENKKAKTPKKESIPFYR